MADIGHMQSQQLENVCKRPLVRAAIALLASGWAVSARAQSLNVDIDATSGPGANVPTETFPGAAASAGRWSSVPATGAGPFRLVASNGGVSTVTLTRAGGAAAFGWDVVFVTGEHSRLLEDIQNVPNPTPTVNPGSTLTIAGLAPGDYEIYTYAIAPDSATLRTVVTLSGSPDGAATVGGAMPTNTFTLGITHCVHRISVLSEEALELNIKGGTASPGSLAGFQIKQIKPGRLYVDSSAPAGGNGRSWATAFRDIPSALAAAGTMNGFGNNLGKPSIWIAQGTYKPTTGMDRGASFVLPPGVSIFGSFRGLARGDGGETKLSERNISVSPSVLSGELGGSETSDNTRSIVRCELPGQYVLDGFTIEGASNDATAPGTREGAGVRIEGAGVVAALTNFTIRRCFSAQGGAGMLIASGAEANITNCFFNQLTAAGDGGAIHVAGSTSKARVTNTRFTACRARSGSAIQSEGSVDVVNGAFTANVGERAAVSSIGTLRLVNCTLAGNLASLDAPAGVERIAGTAALWNCVLWGNAGVGEYLLNDFAQGSLMRQVGVPTAALDVRFSLVHGWKFAHDQFENTGRPPQLKDPIGPDGEFGTSDDNLVGRPFSPQTDSASRALYDQVALGIVTDALGKPREVKDRYTPDGNDKPLDRGAFELQPGVCPGDFNGSGIANSQDVFDFLTAWFSGEERADVNASGDVTLEDFLEFIRRFFLAC